MNRTSQIKELEADREWDCCIIGGGATGLGIAVDAASRGLKTILFERSDLAKGTSSRSTKLVHGGVRYLQQGNIKLVLEALKERGLLLRNAPHLVHNQQFVIPNYSWWDQPFYGIGLKIYDRMAGKLGLGPSIFLSIEETLERLPNLDPEGLTGGVLYHDGQFDDARLAINLAQTAVAQGAAVLNYFQVEGLLKRNENVTGVTVKDTENGNNYTVRAKQVINATGVFTDSILQMDEPGSASLINPSQGVHLVVDKDYLPGTCAIMIPRTDDGRVLFAVPWHDKIVLGTTDTPVDKTEEEPVAQEQEIEFILKHIARYLQKDPQRNDVRSVFTGLRPLVKGKTGRTASLSRDHHLSKSASGLITITGGKWTTYRKMAQDTVNLMLQDDPRPCITETMAIAGQISTPIPASLAGLTDTELEPLIRRAVQEEACMTVEDMLARRSRQLFLDARVAIEIAPRIAEMMAKERGKDEVWKTEQINIFRNMAGQYLPV